MARTGNTSLVEWCLKNGSNTNHLEEVTVDSEPYHYATPVSFYLATFDFSAGHPWDPTKGLQLLLDHGARLGDEVVGSDTDSPCSQRSLGWFRCLSSFLSKRRLTDILFIPCYRRMVEYLIQFHTEIEGTTAAQTVSHCEGVLRWKPELYPVYDNPEKYPSAREDISSAWKLLVMETILPKYQLGLTEFLAQYILHKGRWIEPFDYLARATVEILLAGGADMNPRLADIQDGSTILHQLCRDIGRVWKDSPDGCGALCTSESHIRNVLLIRYVLSKGAYKRVRTLDGRTARELLLEKLIQVGVRSLRE
jgi:hypothetical protein